MLDEPRSPVDEAVLASSFEETGAVVMGRRLFDVVDGPNGWREEVGDGHDQDNPPLRRATSSRTSRRRMCGWRLDSGS